MAFPTKLAVERPETHRFARSQTLVPNRDWGQAAVSLPSSDLKLIALQEVFVERRGRRSLQKCQRAKADYAKRTG